MSAAATTPPQEPGSFGWLLLETTLVLAAICVLAYLVIRLLARRHYGRWSGARGGAGLAVIDRLPLGPRQSLQVVRAGTRVLLVGASDAGLQLLCELEPGDWPSAGTKPGVRFRDLLERGSEAAPIRPPADPPAEGPP